jgi:hypothetical protein
MPKLIATAEKCDIAVLDFRVNWKDVQVEELKRLRGQLVGIAEAAPAFSFGSVARDKEILPAMRHVIQLLDIGIRPPPEETSMDRQKRTRRLRLYTKALNKAICEPMMLEAAAAARDIQLQPNHAWIYAVPLFTKATDK